MADPVLVPMTMVRDDYFDEIIDARHYSLIASPETLRKRLSTRLEALGSRLFGGDETWAVPQIDRCVAALADERFSVHVPTDNRPLDEVVETIAADACPTPARR